MNTFSGIKHISFDLDGTLTDSINTIFLSTVKTLEQLNIPNKLTLEDLRTRVGYHFQDMFLALNIPVTDFEEYLAIYKQHYLEFINKSTLYPGVVEVLSYLNKTQIKISLCTTKVQSQADMIITHFKLSEYFSMILGRRDNIKNKPSAEPLLFICNQLGVKPEDTLIVGDTELDIGCGKNAGAKTCGAAYGYRDMQLLLDENPDYIIKNISELTNSIC
jgi:phosphoglycolate phosphatase/pyrophosphatase PpaX